VYDGPAADQVDVDLAAVAPGEYLLLARLEDGQGALLERAVRVEVR
jgi:hypothetical protein